MLIRFSRPKGKPVLTCIRDDGSLVYTRLRQGEFFARHDLLHYAVESTLGLQHSFFGLIAAGWTIEAFDQAGAARELRAEAVHTEFMVGQLMQEYSFPSPTTAEKFNRLIAAACSQARPVALPPAR